MPGALDLLLYNTIFLLRPLSAPRGLSTERTPEGSGFREAKSLNINSKNGVKISITPVKSYDNLHLKQTQYTILSDCKQKSGVYLIYNKINGNSYIGSAISNRINVRFRNHCIHNTGGNKPLTRAIHKYGLDKFSFHILEFFNGFVQNHEKSNRNQAKSH